MTVFLETSSNTNENDSGPEPGSVNGEKDLLAEAYDLLKSNKPIMAGHGDHPNGQFTSVREINYKNHKIVVKTSYEIEVDGKAMNSQIYVDNNGKVSSHVMPNYSFTSTIDLIKKIIDKFPDNFTKEAKNQEV